LLTKSRPAEPRGKQTPRVSHFPRPDVPRDYSAGLDALDLADIAGRESLPWQKLVVKEGMATDADSQWIAFEVCVLVSRQNGKNGAIEAVELGWMVNEPGISILHTAHEFSTALESMDKLEALIRSHPLLENEIAQVRHGNGRESIRLKNGSIIRFRTRTKSGGRGFSVDRLVIDEAMIWSAASQAAIMPLLTTAERPQIWYLGSAADADEHEHCGKWASLRSRALAGDDPHLLWLEWSAPDAPEDPTERLEWRISIDNWAQANPSLDYLVTEDFIAAEMASFRREIEKWEIERLSAGRWPPDNEDDSALPLDRWQELANMKPALVRINPQVIAVDRDPGNKTWAIAGAQRRLDGNAHIEIGFLGSATATEMVERIVDIVTAANPDAVVIDQMSPAAVLKPYLIEAGIEPVMTNASELALACEGLTEVVESGQVSHSGQKVLNSSVGSAKKRDLPGNRYAWDRKPGGSIAALVAATLAHWGLLTFSRPPRKTAPPMADQTGARNREDEAENRLFTGDFDPMTAHF
jgi:phage terminase large subunit-like protein